MKRILYVLIIFCALQANAQNYLISFTGTGASATVSTVKVENLTKGTSLTLNGSDILRLTVPAGVNSIEDNQSSELKIYPNPMTDNSTLEIFPPVAGDAIITILDMTGKPVAQIQNYLENLRQDFRLSGIINGFYLINVKGNNYHFSGKLLSNGKSNGKISIEKVNNSIQAVDEKAEKTNSKGVQATVDMSYTIGDRLKFTGISGNFSTVRTDIPVQDKTVTFTYAECKDGDNINYSVVSIGTQTWMAENLKTTKYSNGVSIGTTSPLNKDINSESAPKYQWAYAGNESNVATNGRLYTWYAVTDSRNVCPTDWHVPSDAEWIILENYLIANGYNYDGTTTGNKFAKALASTTLWPSYAMPGTVGNTDYPEKRNASGFSALPGGYRDANGSFYDLECLAYWWSTTQTVTVEGMTQTLVRYLYNTSFNINRNIIVSNKTGLSVRCLKDN